MSTRGNSSISPPVQIPLQSQPRQVNISGLPSGTPPPQQQFYPGQSHVSAGVYDYIQPGGQAPAPLLSYQAYGSAPNEIRQAPANGRGGQTSLFQQTAAAMRPQQPAQSTPTYFISGQSGMRQPRPPQQPPTMLFVPPNFQHAGNVVIQSSGLYPPRVPMYPPNQQYTTFAGNFPQVYYPPSQMGRGPMLNPQNQSRPGPPPREKKLIAIKDPNSGRNIDLKEELSQHRPMSTETSDQVGEETPVSQQSSDIPNLFARQVAERLKTPDTSEPVVEGYAANGDVAQGPQLQPPPPGTQQQAAQMAHPAMMRPPMMPGQAPLHPGHMMPPHQGMAGPPMDLSLPPPQLPPHPRQPGPAQMYNVAQQQAAQQQQQQAAQQQQQAAQQQQQQAAQQQQQQQQQQQHQPPQHPVHQPAHHGPRHPVAVVAPPMMAQPPAAQPAQPAQPAVVPPSDDSAHIPAPTQPFQAPEPVPQAREVTPPAPPPPVVEAVPAPAPQEELPSARESTPPKTQEEGSNVQASKDGRKKKGKKDFNRREIGGSDMDAFIDDKSSESVESTDSKPPLPPAANERPAPFADKAAASTPVEKPEKPAFSYAAAATAAVDVPKAKEASPPPPVVPDPEPVVPAAPAKEESPPKPEVKEVAPVVRAPSESKVDVPQSPVQKEESPVVEKAAPAPVQKAIPDPSQSVPPPQQAPAQPAAPPASQPSPPAATPPQQASPVNDENAPPKEPAKPDRKDEPPATEEEGSKKPVEKPKQKIDEPKEKLQYDRKYLMELRECASSQTKPEGLPNLDIILDKPNISPIRGSMNAPLDFTPSFFQPTAGTQRHAPQIGKSSSRGRQRPDMPQQRIIKSVSIQNDVKLLHQSEKPWKPKTPGNAGDSEKSAKSLESDVLFIMNRLTPTNFEKLAHEMRQLNISTYDDLVDLVKIFFDKVTIETKFVIAYAQLCRVMAQLKVPPPADKGIKENQATFRVVMLTKCQQEFEADKSIIFEDPEEKRRKLQAEMEDAPDKDEKIEEVLYRMKLKRLKFYGNIRFIGELFKLGMLTENIMHDCIFRLLKARDDDSLLSLCNLITTVGQMLDTDKAKSRMDQYFNQMEKIAEERKSRIKFTLKDAIELRKHNWVPRKETTGPKRIDEVHKDFQAEQARQQILSAAPLPPRNEAPQPGSRRGSRQRQEEKPSDDGWNTVGSKSMKIDASKMKLSKNVVDEDNIQLGPGGGMNRFSSWGRGSGGGSQSSQDNDRLSPATNRFSALRSDEDRRTFQRSPSRGDTAGRGLRQGPTAGHGRGKILSRSSQEGERRELLASARSIVGGGRSQNSSRDNSWNREDRRPSMGPRGSREGENVMTRSDISRPSAEEMRPPVAPPAKKIKEMSADEMETKAKNILKEYLNIKDLAEAKLCVSELAGQPKLHLVVTASINDVLESKTQQSRDLTGQYLHELVRSNILSLDAYGKGLVEVLEFAEDMVIDIPMLWDYLAQVTAPLLVGGSLPWTKLATLVKPALNQRCSLLFMTKLVLHSKKLTSEPEVAQQWQDSGLSWASFVAAPSDVDSHLKEHKLEFTVRPAGGSPADLARMATQVETMVAQRLPNQEIIALIEKLMPVESRDNAFIRALTTSITNASITRPDMKVNEEAIKFRRELFQAYINNPEHELQALYAIQALMAKLEHPKGVAIDLFDQLYNEELISEEAFKRWEVSTDPAEQEGKGACSMQLTQFFTWLRENDDTETAS